MQATKEIQELNWVQKELIKQSSSYSGLCGLSNSTILSKLEDIDTLRSLIMAQYTPKTLLNRVFKASIYCHLWSEGLSQAQIGCIFGVSQHNVQIVIRNHRLYTESRALRESRGYQV